MQSAEFRMQNDCSSRILVHFALCILHTFKCRVQNSECRMTARQESWFILHSAFSTLHLHAAPVPQQLQGEFRKLVFVGASPTRGPSSNAECRIQNAE